MPKIGDGIEMSKKSDELEAIEIGGCLFFNLGGFGVRVLALWQANMPFAIV